MGILVGEKKTTLNEFQCCFTEGEEGEKTDQLY